MILTSRDVPLSYQHLKKPDERSPNECVYTLKKEHTHLFQIFNLCCRQVQGRPQQNCQGENIPCCPAVPLLLTFLPVPGYLLLSGCFLLLQPHPAPSPDFSLSFPTRSYLIRTCRFSVLSPQIPAG